MEQNKNKILADFLRIFKVASTNAAIYSREHSVVLKSLEELLAKINTALAAFGMIDIFVSPVYMVVCQNKFDKDPLLVDLAKFLHYRSIKYIKIKRGVMVEELNRFFATVSMRPKDIIMTGGLEALLKKEGIMNITVELLDFSQILKSGKEDADIWAHLLRESVEQGDLQKIEAIIGYFAQMVKEIRFKDFFTHEALRKGIEKFLNYLKSNNNISYTQNVKILLRTFLKNGETLKEQELPPELKTPFTALSPSDLAEVLLEELLTLQDSDLSIFEFFSKYIDEEKNKLIAANLVKRIEEVPSARMDVPWKKRITELLSKAKDPIVQQIYSPVLSSVIEKISAQETFLFDRNALPAHYRSILFQLFLRERREQWLMAVIDKIQGEFTKISGQEKSPCLMELLKLVELKRSTCPDQKQMLSKMDEFLSSYIEKMILAGDTLPAVDSYIDNLKTSSVGVQHYLDRIFRENQINTDILRLFFRFFPNDFTLFSQQLVQKKTDLEFLVKLISNVKGLNPFLTLDILKQIFTFANPYVKGEVITVMGSLSYCDRNFLFSLVESLTEESFLKEKALHILIRDEQDKQRAIKALLDLPNAMGKNNAVLEEHIRMIGRLDLKEAKEDLLALGRKQPFWNRSIKAQISDVLEGWERGTH